MVWNIITSRETMIIHTFKRTINRLNNYLVIRSHHGPFIKNYSHDVSHDVYFLLCRSQIIKVRQKLLSHFYYYLVIQSLQPNHSQANVHIGHTHITGNPTPALSL